MRRIRGSYGHVAYSVNIAPVPFSPPQDLILARASDFACTAVETMAEALAWCWDRSRPGDAIVLSPACASKDQFQNCRQRGETFVELVLSLADGHGGEGPSLARSPRHRYAY